ncbi:hypothetical protein J4476_04305 [Candidatus Woesearchaeota archaeon]|nr:MAG: hypothetical protein QT09_C0014G0013 [archaeon GW2011_AR18]MBS3161886.1 hypothetical protein [Candidatus Woesearchaeota archaeon]HIH25185.1 hypothetical protein [Nanoarchaeota archaeon]
MRILYGVCGVGAGHYTRSKILIEYLLKKKHEVMIIGGLAAYDYLKKDFDNVYYAKGLQLILNNNNSVSAIKTFFKNYKIFIKKDYIDNETLKQIDKFNPEIVISDFEPGTLYYAEKNNIKSITFDNEHYITDGNYTIPKFQIFDYLTSKFVVGYNKADENIVLTLPGQKLKNKSKAIRIDPVIRKSLIENKKKVKNSVLIYLSITKNKKILEELKKFSEEFIVYGFNQESKDNNITFKNFSEENFDKDIKECKAVITTGGINLISEAIYLKKPILVIPIKKQFEQYLNALYVNENNYGNMYKELTEENLRKFLINLKIYKKKSYNPGNNELFKIIDKKLGEK